MHILGGYLSFLALVSGVFSRPGLHSVVQQAARPGQTIVTSISHATYAARSPSASVNLGGLLSDIGNVASAEASSSTASPTTSYPVTVTDCENYADPDSGSQPGCQCDNWSGILPYLSGSNSYSYITLASSIPALTSTNTFDTTVPFPYTITMSNNGIVAFESTSSAEGAGPWLSWTGAGSSTIIQIGTSIQIDVAQKNFPPQNVGYFTGDTLYTAVSEAIVTACPSPTSGSTVLACATPSPITHIAYQDGNWLSYGDLAFSFPIVKYSDPVAYKAMVAGIAAIVKASSMYPANTYQANYTDPCAECEETTQQTNSVNLTHIPGAVMASYYVQDESTNGNLTSQALEVEFEFELEDDGFDLGCSVAALAIDCLGVLALIPGMEWLAGVLAPEAFGVSISCFLGSVTGKTAAGETL